MDQEMTILRSRRRTLSLEIQADGRVLARAPYGMPAEEIEAFARQKAEWIRKHQQMQGERRKKTAGEPPLTMEEIRELGERALEELPKRVANYAARLGVTYGRITIRNQKSRWGSCSGAGNLNFNCLLMLAPPEVRDYVVVHELCHRKEMNHSARFWKEVENILPDYRQRRAWLKENGGRLIARMTGENR